MHPEAMELEQSRRTTIRTDRPAARPAWHGLESRSSYLLLIIMACLVFAGGDQLELGPADAAVGLAAAEGLGPLGRYFGQWRPELWPLRVLLSEMASLLSEDGRSWPGTVLWPGAISAGVIGWLLARRLGDKAGARGGLLLGLGWFGSVGVIDHSGATGLDFVAGLATIAALDRLLEKRSDLAAGTWSALAFLAGGWPPVAIILMTVIVLGRPQSGFTWRLLLPPLLALAGWSGWTLSTASAEALAAALALPFTHPSAWGLALSTMALGLPLAPFALLGLSRSIRTSWSEPARAMTVGWFQVALVCLISGTVVPGLAGAAAVPALAGMLVAAAATFDAGCSGRLPGRSLKIMLVTGFGISLCWLLVVCYAEPFCLVMVSYYRPVGIVVLVLTLVAVGIAWLALRTSSGLRGAVALATLTAALKLAHLGVFVPEWNYQHGEGPWGRAIGQWLLPNWPVYTIHDWPTDLAFAIGRQVRQLPTPRHLAFESPADEAKHVLLLESEFSNWPADAPALTKVAEFQDRWGGRRILARTAGILVAPSGVHLGPGVQRLQGDAP